LISRQADDDLDGCRTADFNTVFEPDTDTPFTYPLDARLYDFLRLRGNAGVSLH
jgi:hypothetical protein